MQTETDDTSSVLSAWKLLDSNEGHPLVEAASSAPEATPALIRQLRRDWPVEAVSSALELARARTRAGIKFPGLDALWSDVIGLEQASSRCTADWKAARFERADAREIADLCCGIGGDAMSLVDVGQVLAVDHDPVRAWMAGRNAGCDTRVADVRSLQDCPEFVHIDPARRDGATGHRRWNPESYEPAFAEILELMKKSRGSACKMGPGIPMPLPGRPEGGEIEFLQEGSRLVQAVVWSGALAEHPDQRTATLLPDGHTLSGFPGELPLAEDDPRPGSWLLEPRAALERAGLLDTAIVNLNGDPCEIAPGLGLLCSDAPSESPWFTDWRIEGVVPLREKQIKAWLRAHDGGEVIVRTRGGAVDVDRWGRSLRGKGETTWVLFALRLGLSTRAILTQPVG
ncbi:MAG: class I SAM-dependent methyltransferase [Phycisphaerales bacterium]|nr:class I SAM-dependent methyltransferase [Phycisphaerales bacterium]